MMAVAWVRDCAIPFVIPANAGTHGYDEIGDSAPMPPARDHGSAGLTKEVHHW